MNTKKILLGQLTSFGDCVFATTVARQIKADFPDCHLTWAISSMFRSVLINNPHVDAVWEIPINNTNEIPAVWAQFEKDALARKEKGEFDEVYFTQVFPNNYKNFDGTVRYSIFRGYPKPITVPVTPSIRLTDSEVERVQQFAQTHKIHGKKNVILFECAAHSRQSFVTPNFALEVSKLLVQKIPDTHIILSSNIPISSSDHRIIDGSVLTIRENAELTKYCSLLVGCSSGISWLCTSDWAKPLPMVQLLKKGTSIFASFVHDFKYRNENVQHILEMTDCSAEYLTECLALCAQDKFAVAREHYHENIPLKFDFYCWTLGSLIYKGKFTQALSSLRVTVQRYGWRIELLQAMAAFPFKIFKYLFQRN